MAEVDSAGNAVTNALDHCCETHFISCCCKVAGELSMNGNVKRRSKSTCRTMRTTTCCLSYIYILLLSLVGTTNSFTSSPSLHNNIININRQVYHPSATLPDIRYKKSQSAASTALNVWWFGGSSEMSETSTSGEECELVAVRIDRTSPNSRRIAGEIVVNTPLMDVWAILTDYDNLSVHVPNLVASKRIRDSGGEGGDGTHKCRLYQRGAQKIVGFEFGADVTMDMSEKIAVPGHKPGEIDLSPTNMFPEERRIDFKCVDSQFFSEFDGTWKVVSMPDNPFTGEPETTVSYTVEVRPKGPVPVGALEWRIREDVPTNLRAVKKAAIEVGLDGVMAKKNGGGSRIGKAIAKLTGSKGSEKEESSLDGLDFADFILDYENETLGAYIEK